ncbi:hypothetical protein [Massilibacteroides sp.]|uniref:hypothetical protein n=1 Tax=Massilibacteroides sp. TaxID=2034766 RepID=UPI00262CDB7E|nr:hypothetical protein [Massilibacteroides sp.]MDD4516766.1 hypothetical protein [Massilibacteroides sp.]
MRPISFIFIVSYVFFLFGCTQQNKIIELPLTSHTGYGPFNSSLGAMSPDDLNENNPWRKTMPMVLVAPEGLTDVKYGHVETDIFQNIYQNYLAGNISQEWYDKLQVAWNWTPDTVNLSKDQLKTKIIFAFGKDSTGAMKIVVDANNNLDLSDEIPFTAVDMEASGSLNSVHWL